MLSHVERRERGTAAQVVDAAREMRRSGLTVSSLGNVSMRLGERIWITPSRVCSWELTPDQLVTVGLDGDRLSSGEPSRELPLHLEIYRRNPSTRAVIHTHSPWAVAWSHLRADLALPTEELRYHGLGSIPCAAKAPAGTLALARSGASALADTPVALLADHGVVARAASPQEALELCALAEQQAHVEWLLQSRRSASCSTVSSARSAG
jgi:L-fuculose-phosphate aldolase